MARGTPPAAFRHGGRLAEAAAAFPDAPKPWIDLSTGINPRSWRGSRAPAAALRRLPDPADLAALEATAARAFGVADPARVVAVPGSEAGLRLLPGLIGAATVDIAGPTYGSHVQAWAGATVAVIPRAVLADSAADVLVVVNPNNPDGATTDAKALAALAERRADRGQWLIVDEAFVEAAPHLSVANQAVDRLVVLRSFGKVYGLPGARLGFVVADPAIAAGLRARLGDWPLSADAIALGRATYADAAWRARTVPWLHGQAQRLDGLLRATGFEIVGGTSLFRLAAAPDAAERFARLAAAGVLTRPFDYAPTWLRFGLPEAGDWARVRAALEDLA
ncbi:MAG: threonine-phosphate decarboxylase [Caulobacter sp.]|nr:threonine-phosphate decarboxylase [Caulobacter sp.]